MWTQVEEARYDEMLSLLPPALLTVNGFLVGEPHDYRKCNATGGFRACYAAFVTRNGKFFEGPNLTVSEFHKLDLDSIG